MTGHPDIEELEAFAEGAGAAETAAHVAGCAECAREVEWIKAEQALFAQRSQPQVDGLWKGVEERIANTATVPAPLLRRPHWHRRGVAAAGAVAAAAAIFFGVHANRARIQEITGTAQPKPPPVAQQDQRAPAGAAGQPPNGHHPHLDAKALAALDTAENDYRHAAQVLEAEYDSLRPQLDPALAKKWDETLTRARAQLAQSRQAVASDDARARMRVLDGYAEYLRSLRDVIQDSEEATP
ncbi:MAG TPA: hypothetical protein VGH20_11970 [Myxococcales bacterium]|jgi:hypothetical protein